MNIDILYYLINDFSLDDVSTTEVTVYEKDEGPPHKKDESNENDENNINNISDELAYKKKIIHALAKIWDKYYCAAGSDMRESQQILLEMDGVIFPRHRTILYMMYFPDYVGWDNAGGWVSDASIGAHLTCSGGPNCANLAITSWLDKYVDSKKMNNSMRTFIVAVTNQYTSMYFKYKLLTAKIRYMDSRFELVMADYYSAKYEFDRKLSYQRTISELKKLGAKFDTRRYSIGIGISASTGNDYQMFAPIHRSVVDEMRAEIMDLNPDLLKLENIGFETSAEIRRLLDSVGIIPEDEFFHVLAIGIGILRR